MIPKPLHTGSLKWQGKRSTISHSGTCPLCQTHKKLVADHCHRTGYKRDPLCRKCNMALGLFADNPQHLRRAAAYLERHAQLHQQYRDRP